MKVLRIETQTQIENLRKRNDQQVERVLEYGLKKQAAAVEDIARKVQGPPRNLTEPQKEYYPEKAVQRDKVFEPRSEMRMGTVEGPEIGYAENVTTRIKSEKRNFLKKQNALVMKHSVREENYY